MKGKGIKEDALKNYGMFLKHLESHIIDPKEPIDQKDYLQSDKIIKAIKKIKTSGLRIDKDDPLGHHSQFKGGELKGLPDYEHLNWGSFTKTFKAFNKKHPRINSLEKYAKYVIRHKEDFQRKTLKRAYFYIDVIRKEGRNSVADGGAVKGIDSDSSSDSDSDSDSESDSDEGDAKNEIDDYLLGFGIKNISTNNIMPKFAKGSEDMKNHMRKLREMRGRGVKGSKSKTHKGEEDYTTKKGDKYYHQLGHLVEGEPYMKGGMFKKLFGKKDDEKKPERKTIRSANEVLALQNNTEDFDNEWNAKGIQELFEDGIMNEAQKQELLNLISARNANRVAADMTGDPAAKNNYDRLNAQINANINILLDLERERHIEGKGFRHRKRHSSGGAVLLPKGHLANKLDLSSYMPRNFNVGLSTTSMMNVPQSRTPRVINAGGIRPPPMLNSSRQRYEGIDDSSRLGAAGNMSYKSLMSL